MEGEIVLDSRARARTEGVVGPLIRGMVRFRIAPMAVTAAGLLVTIAGAGLIAAGQLVAGALVAGAGAFLDALDGPLARATGRASTRGALIDAVSDRLGEAAVWAGLAYFVSGDRVAVTLCAVGLATSLLTSYVRSKAEGFGGDGRGGFMGRAERLILLLVGVGLDGLDLTIFGESLVLVTLWTVAVLTGLTVVQRVVRAWTQITE